MPEKITIGEFCLHHTQVGELCVFRDTGYIVGSTWIDNEDLFAIHDKIRNAEMKSHSWGTISITTEHGDKLDVPCHYIDF